MNEKDFLQKIKNDADDLTPPASLHPDAIEQMLREQQKQQKNQQETPASDPVTDFSSRKKPNRYRTFIKYGSIAAVFFLSVSVLYHFQETIAPDDHQQMETVMDQDSAAAAPETAGAMPQDTAAAPETDTVSTSPAFTEAFSYADSPESIYNTLYERFYQNNSYQISGYGKSARNDIVEDSADFGSTASMDILTESSMEMVLPETAAGSSSNPEFSETNVQEKGVDEGDIVKTDGTYIYILRQDLSLAILKANGKDSETISLTRLDTSENAVIQEMFLDGTTLNVIISEYTTSLDSDDEVYYTNSYYQAKLLTYDITDKKAPLLTGTVTQEGAYETSRKNGSCIYLFTSYYPDLQSTYEESTILPRINQTVASAGDVFLPDSLTDSTYLVISSVDTASPDRVLDSKILVSGVSNFYVSTENIYIANTKYGSGQTMTEITKFHYSDGEITGVSAASVKGYLNNSFSMNEYEDNLRVVSTYTGDEFNALRDLASDITGIYYEENLQEHNSLYVLDEKLQQIGAIEGLADDETIRSARFLGDTGYFVTFRQTDPLFSVDLSDPTDPKILGELKVSGFSSYLHFYGEDLLLGIGYEANEENGVTTGLKLSMFDISDPSNVTEISRLVLPGITWCPAIEDYKSILVDPEKNLIGFFCDNRYLVFSYDPEKGFVNELTYDFYSDMLLGQAEYNTMRGLYIEDTFYLAGNTFLISFDMDKDFEKTGVITI